MTFTILVIVETLVLHLLLLRYSLLLALAVSLLSLSALVWLIGDYVALGSRTSTITDESLMLRVGWRATAQIPLKLLVSAISPSWRDLPNGPNRSYLNVSRPAEPNVLLTFSDPVMIHLPGGLRRSIRMLAVFVDTPEDFLAAIWNGKSVAGGGQPNGQLPTE